MFRKTLKRSVSILTLLAMMLTLFPFAAFAEDTTASDLDGHWAEEVMQEWIGYGIIAGYEDGTVRPDRSITRAEMTALLDRVMDYQTTAANHFTDLDDNWYTDVVLKANAAGMISGYPDGTVRPNATISRQEAVAMFARVLSLDTANAPEADFTDMDAVGDWAKDAVNAMAAKGYVNGDNGQFRPQSGITRAEVITIFNNIFDDLYAESGTYFGDIDGSAVISADDVTLRNTTIGGDLIVAEGVGDGHVVLDNVTIDGKLIIRGGGENSVIIRGNSSIGTVTVERTDGAVRVAVEDGASVDTLFVNDGNDTVTVEGSIGTLNVATGAAEIVLNGDTDTLNVSSENAVVTISGTLGTVTVDEAASDATINVQSDASVSTLTTAATNTTVNVLGSVETVQVADTASDATIAVSENASVNSVTTAAQNTTVSGEGTVTSVEVGETASGATVTTPGTSVENNSNDDVTIGDGETIGAGETATTPGGTTEEPSEPSTPSEPSRPSHTHTYVDGVCTAGDAYDPTWAQVNSAETWNTAVAAGQNIVLTADFTTDAQLTIDNTNSETGSITVNGNGHTITATGEQPWENVNGEKHLVLITDAADSTTTADNVTLKNITLNSDGKAYGLQSYCVTNTVLDNVTLTGSVGAGLTVNGSTTTATGLHTSDNEWGGVNVDQGSNVTDETTFTFDATSTFAETAKVYSDAGNVTVNAPEGWACVQIDGNYVWSNLFAGGDGTTDNPYLITTAEQLAAMFNYAGYDEDHAANEFFKIADGTSELAASAVLSNIDSNLKKEFFEGYTGYGCYVSDFSGTLDGNNATLTNLNLGEGYYALICQMDGGTIKNLKVTLDHSKASVLCGAITNQATMENISVSADGIVQTGNNYAPFVYEAYNSTLKNCNNYVDINGTYFAAFVGYWAENATFENCNNWGNLTGTYVGVLIGNQTSEKNNGLTITNCHNYGMLYGSNKVGFVTGNPRQQTENDTLNGTHVGNLTSSTEVNGITYTGQAISHVTLQSFAIDSDGKITQTTDNDKGVSYYQAVYTGYAKNSIEGGTLFINIFSKMLSHTGSGTLDSTFKTGCKMIDYASATEGVKTACAEKWINNTVEDANYDKYAIVTVGETTYCVINFVNTALTIDATATLVARAYDANGNMLTQVSVN